MSSHLPQGWKLKSVGELSNVKRGASPRPIKDAKWWGGNTGWVRISDVTSSRKYLKNTTQYLSDEGVTKSVKIDKGEVVLTICATIGRAIIISVDACIHDGFVWFDKLGNSINREFWYYFLASKEDFFKAQRQSGTQGNLNTSIVSDVLCMLPPLPEQQKIAKILTSVDEVIEKTRAKIDKLKHLKKGIMQELLTNGIGHTEFKDSPVGRIPAEWEVKPIGDFVNSMVGGAPLRPSDFSDEGVRVIPKKAVQFGGELIFDKKTFCTTDFADKNRKNIVSSEYLITTLRDLVPTGPTIGVIGELLESGGLILAQGVYGLRTHGIDRKYLVQLSNSDWYRKEMRKVFVGSTQVHIRNQEFLDILIPIPPINEQKAISDTLNSIDIKVRGLIAKSSSTERIKKALMQDLLTGNVRVNGD